MASFPSNIEKRNVLPYWRSFIETVRRGEVASLADVSAVPIIPITTYVHDWNAFQSVAAGGDLLSAAIMNGQIDAPAVKEAARFLLEHEDELSAQLKRSAQRVLYGLPEIPKANESVDALLNNREDLIRKIRILKRYNQVYSRNPVAYVELASYYTQIGNIERAKEAMNIALRIAPNQRFVSRSAARFFMHIDESDRAYSVLFHNESVKRDPWLLASEIAVSTANGKVSQNIKNGQRVLESDINPYELSELGSAIGTVEMMRGSRKKARQAMSLAIKSPNDNGFAQAMWWAKHYGESVDFSRTNAYLSLYEAESIENLFQDDYDKSLSAAIKWLVQMPFSKRAALFASEVAYTYIKDYDIANKILKVGLQASPLDTVLLNNLAYSSALGGDVAQAEEMLKILNAEIKKDDNIRERVCYDATCGLTEYRKGHPDKGAELYQKAIMQAIESKDKDLANLAMLNYIREEVQYSPSFDASVLDHLDELICENQKEADQIKKDIRAIYEKKKAGEST